MLFLIVSANALFREIIHELFIPELSEVIEVNCDESLSSLCELTPDVVIVDVTLPPPCLDRLLAEARSKQMIRVIVVDPLKNEIVLLDSRRATLTNVADIEVFSSRDFKIHSSCDECTGCPYATN